MIFLISIRNTGKRPLTKLLSLQEGMFSILAVFHFPGLLGITDARLILNSLKGKVERN